VNKSIGLAVIDEKSTKLGDLAIKDDVSSNSGINPKVNKNRIN